MNPPSDNQSSRLERLARANELLRTIAGCGRRFFACRGRTAQLELDARGRLWLRDAYTDARIYTHYRGRWRKFSGGGTLRMLVEHLRHYVLRDRALPSGLLGPWPATLCDGDLWGYGADMAKVRAAAERLVGYRAEAA